LFAASLLQLEGFVSCKEKYLAFETSTT